MSRIQTPLALALFATALLAQTETMPQSRPATPQIPADTEIQTTKSGLKYSILRPGTPGGKSPTQWDIVKIHYTGWFPDGRMFDSSVTRGQPLEYPLRGFIKGWIEGLALMTPGAKFKLTVPPELGYGKAGKAGRPGIPPDATLVFEIELLSFKEGPKPPDFPKIDESKLTATKSGLKYLAVKEGEGKAPAIGQQATVNYAGWFMDGKLFDASYLTNRPYTFRVPGEVIAGWNEGIQLMKEGSKYIFVIPPELAYGKTGFQDIPPNATLVFQIELIKVN